MKPEKDPISGVLLTLPTWLEKQMAAESLVFPTAEARMRWVIGLSRRNVEPPAAGRSPPPCSSARRGRLLGAGVNRVEPLNLLAGPRRDHGHRLRPAENGKTFDLGAAAPAASW